MTIVKQYKLVELEDMFITIPVTWSPRNLNCFLPNYKNVHDLKKPITSYKTVKEDWKSRDIIDYYGTFGKLSLYLPYLIEYLQSQKFFMRTFT